MPTVSNFKLNLAVLFWIILFNIIQSVWLAAFEYQNLYAAVLFGSLNTVSLYLTLVASNYILTPGLKHRNHFLIRTLYFVFLIVLAGAWGIGNQWLFEQLLQTLGLPFAANPSYQFYNLLLGLIIIMVYRFFYVQAQSIKAEQAFADQITLNEQLKKEAELFKLRQQLHPHFLFNSLNSINALLTVDKEAAQKMLHHLSDFLRHNLKKDDEDYVTVETEIQDIQNYLSIEQVRFGHRLKCQIEIPEGCKQLLIPPFLLQPLIENAIKFGLYSTLEDVEITLSMNLQPHFLQIQIKNPFDPTAVPPKGTGFGLEGVRRRLYILYNNNQLLQTERTVDSKPHYLATLKIPQ